eukprot:COSAG02_NODE_11404_length_1730_cov_1.623544_3_plen_236_part_00
MARSRRSAETEKIAETVAGRPVQGALSAIRRSRKLRNGRLHRLQCLQRRLSRPSSGLAPSHRLPTSLHSAREPGNGGAPTGRDCTTMAAGCWAGPSSAKAVNSPAPHCVKEERDDAPETRNTPKTMAGATVSPETTITSAEIVEPTSNDTEEAKVGVVAPECTGGVDGGTDTTPSVSSELGSPKADTSAFVGEAAALSLEPVTPEAQETAPTKPKPDTELTVGTRILVDGMGEGT